MNRTKMATCVLLVLFSTSTFAALNVVHASVETPVDTEEVLMFLKDVVQLDMSKYEARLSTKATNYWSWFGEVAHTSGQYVLDSTSIGGTSILTVTFTFWDQELVSCAYYEVSQGPTLYSRQPATDLINAASDFLQRYQTYTGDAQLTQMRSTIDGVKVTSNMTKTIDSLKLEVLFEERSHDNKTLFSWSNTLNSADYSRLRLEFRNGEFSEFGDDRSFYKLGSSEVNISREEAVSIALERVKSYSYPYNDEKITGFEIVEEQIRSKPSFLNRTERMVLYPCWIVDLPLNRIYPDSVAYIKVLIWADKGEVISCEAMGYGFPSEYFDSTPSPTPVNTPLLMSPSPQNTQANNNIAPATMYIVAACVIIVVSIAVIAVVFKGKRR